VVGYSLLGLGCDVNGASFWLSERSEVNDTKRKKQIEPRMTRITTDEEGLAGTPGVRAAAAFSNPFPSELARDSENTPLLAPQASLLGRLGR